MKRVLYVCHTQEAARQKFYEFIKQTHADSIAERIVVSQLLVEFPHVRHQFVSIHGIEEWLRGMEYSSIIVDEAVSLTDEQASFLRSRERI
jgi:hypothetical protein